MLTTTIPAVQLTNAKDHIFDIYRQIHRLRFSTTTNAELATLSSKVNAYEQKIDSAQQAANNAVQTATESLTESKKLTDAIRYDANGLDTDKVSDHFVSLISSAIGQLSVLVTNEDGLFFIDENMNVGCSINSDGLHAINILEYSTD